MKVHCHQCGQKLEAEDAWLGRTAPCPSCGASVVLVPPGGRGAVGTRPPKGPSAGGQRWVVLSAVMLVAILIWLWLQGGSGGLGGRAGVVARGAARAVFGTRGQAAGSAVRQAIGPALERLLHGGGRLQSPDSSPGDTNSANAGTSRNRQRWTRAIPEAVRAQVRAVNAELEDDPTHSEPPVSQPADAALQNPDLPSRSIGRLDPVSANDRRGSEARAGEGGTDPPATTPGNAASGQSEAPDGSRAPDSNLLPTNRLDYENGRAGASTLPNGGAATNVALLSDDFSDRLQRAGARSGDVQVSLMWNNVNDLDLHCVDPNNEEIYYEHRQSRSGGLLDVDMNVNPPLQTRPVENIYWPEQAAPEGSYRVYVNHFSNHGGRDPTAYTVRVLTKGRISQYSGSIGFGQPKKLVCQFTVPPS